MAPMDVIAPNSENKMAFYTVGGNTAWNKPVQLPKRLASRAKALKLKHSTADPLQRSQLAAKQHKENLENIREGARATLAKGGEARQRKKQTLVESSTAAPPPPPPTNSSAATNKKMSFYVEGGSGDWNVPVALPKRLRGRCEEMKAKHAPAEPREREARVAANHAAALKAKQDKARARLKWKRTGFDMSFYTVNDSGSEIASEGAWGTAIPVPQALAARCAELQQKHATKNPLERAQLAEARRAAALETVRKTARAASERGAAARARKAAAALEEARAKAEAQKMSFYVDGQGEWNKAVEMPAHLKKRVKELSEKHSRTTSLDSRMAAATAAREEALLQKREKAGKTLYLLKQRSAKEIGSMDMYSVNGEGEKIEGSGTWNQPVPLPPHLAARCAELAARKQQKKAASHQE